MNNEQLTPTPRSVIPSKEGISIFLPQRHGEHRVAQRRKEVRRYETMNNEQ